MLSGAISLYRVYNVTVCPRNTGLISTALSSSVASLKPLAEVLFFMNIHASFNILSSSVSVMHEWLKSSFSHEAKNIIIPPTVYGFIMGGINIIYLTDFKCSQELFRQISLITISTCLLREPIYVI